MAVRRDGRGHQSPGRQALCEGRDHILCVWRAPRPRAGSVFTGPGGAPPRPSLAVSSPPVVTRSAWAPGPGGRGLPLVTFPGGSGGWHPITPCPSCKRGRHVLGVDGGCAGAGSAPGPEKPAWAMFRSTQCGVLEAALPRRRPSAHSGSVTRERPPAVSLRCTCPSPPRAGGGRPVLSPLGVCAAPGGSSG